MVVARVLAMTRIFSGGYRGLTLCVVLLLGATGCALSHGPSDLDPGTDAGSVDAGDLGDDVDASRLYDAGVPGDDVDASRPHDAGVPDSGTDAGEPECTTASDCTQCIVGEVPATEDDCECLACSAYPKSFARCEADTEARMLVCRDWRPPGSDGGIVVSPCPLASCRGPIPLACLAGRCVEAGR